MKAHETDGHPGQQLDHHAGGNVISNQCCVNALPTDARSDVVDRNSAEEERIEWAARLLHAREQERSRLAREIHDDFCQRLAVMSVRLQTLHTTVTDRPTASLVEEVMDGFSSLGQDLQALSREWHPSRLESIGLIPSLTALCTDISRRHHIQVEFTCGSLSGSLAADARLSLYRIVQEALHNVVKHSGASKVRVRLDADSDAVSLSVEDNGCGFDMSAESAHAGIGVPSMEERAAMLGGTCDIRSRPSLNGTSVTVTIPG